MKCTKWHLKTKLFDKPIPTCYNFPTLNKPPLSSGPGRGPLKAETWVRIPLGADPPNWLIIYMNEFYNHLLISLYFFTCRITRITKKITAVTMATVLN